MPTSHSESSITTLLRKRYAAPEWAFLSQVRNQTGYDRHIRYLDGLAMNLYPSRGMELHGFEIKTSRSDWLSELRKPGKAEATVCYCDRFWVVTPKDLIKPGELPPTWGWLTAGEDSLHIAVAAPALTPTALDRGFIASVLRNFDDSWVPATEVKARIEARLTEVRKEHENQDNLTLESLQQKLMEKEALIVKFRQETGLRIDDWRFRDLAAAIRLVMDDKDRQSLLERKKEFLQQAKYEHQRLETEVKSLEKAGEVLKMEGSTQQC